MRSTIVPSLGILAAMMAADDSLAGAGATTTTEAGKFEEETGFISLAALAGIDSDGVAAIANRVPPKGLWHTKGESVKITGGGKGDDGKPKPFNVTFTHLVLGGKSTDPSFDNEKMVDRKLKQRFTIWPSDMEEGIGLLKGMYAKVGIQNSGMPLGGVEGQAPGWVDLFTASELNLKITHGTRGEDTVAYFDWVPLEQEAAGESGE